MYCRQGHRWITHKAVQQAASQLTESCSVEISSPHPISNIRFVRCTSPLKVKEMEFMA